MTCGKFDKVCPYVLQGPWHYRKTKPGVYVYMHPFHPWNKTYNIAGENFKFKYLPIYIGKYERPHGARPVQHISAFLRNVDTIKNPNKRNYFQDIERQMENNKNDPAADFMKPFSWESYIRNGWVTILKEFDTPAQAREFEREAIKAIGTIDTNTGPLANAAH